MDKGWRIGRLLGLLAVACWVAGCGGQPGPRWVTVEGRAMYVDGARYQIRGVGYSPVPVGQSPDTWSWPTTSGWYDDDFELLHLMNCNTIRTWSKVTRPLLDAAWRHGLLVVCGFPADPAAHDFSLPAEREALKEEFRAYVGDFEQHPAVLMWCVGNEVNQGAGESSYWYSLLDEMAAVAHAEEGEPHHPVTTANGETSSIGSPVLQTTDAEMPNLDLWGANVYRGLSFSALFQDFETRSGKPLWISEYGTDAFDARPTHQTVDEETQAQVALGLWREIEGNLETCAGGALMEFCDEWWKMGDPSVHDASGMPLPALPPDATANEEYWGMFAVAPREDGPDARTPRRVYEMLGGEWQP